VGVKDSAPLYHEVSTGLYLQSRCICQHMCGLPEYGGQANGHRVMQMLALTPQHDSPCLQAAKLLELQASLAPLQDAAARVSELQSQHQQLTSRWVCMCFRSQ
jgi:hypothetical protein